MLLIQSLCQGVECKVCQRYAKGSKVTKPSLSNSAKRYYSDLAESVLEPSLIKSALVFRYLYKKYFRSSTNIQESIYSHDNNTGYVGPSRRSWRDSCVPRLGSWGNFIGEYPPGRTQALKHLVSKIL